MTGLAAPEKRSRLFFFWCCFGEKQQLCSLQQRGRGELSGEKQLVRVTKFILQSHQLTSEPCSINTALLLALSIKRDAGKGHCSETFPGSLRCTKLAKPQGHLAMHPRGKYLKRQDSKPPWLPRQLSCSRAPNAPALPQPQFEQTAERDAFLFYWHYAQTHTDYLLPGYRQHQQKTRFRQTKPASCLVDLPPTCAGSCRQGAARLSSRRP